jgi:hypothetical protein
MSIFLNTSFNSLSRSANIPSASNFSVSGWVRCTAVQLAGFNSLFVLSDGALNSTHTAMVGCHFNNDNTDLNGRRNINANAAFSALPSAATWIYVALSCSGSGTNLFKGYWWQPNGTLGGTFTATADQAGTTMITMVLGARNGGTIQGHIAYWRVWDRVLTQANFESEMVSQTIVDSTNINTAIGTANADDVSGNNRHWTIAGVAFDTSGTYEPPIGGLLSLDTSTYLFVTSNSADSSTSGSVVQFSDVVLVKKLKVLVRPTAASASGVSGVVWQNGTGGEIAGAEIGEFTGAAFESATEGSGVNERAVLKVPVANFGGSALSVSDTVKVHARNSTHTTGIVSGTIIEE